MDGDLPKTAGSRRSSLRRSAVGPELPKFTRVLRSFTQLEADHNDGVNQRDINTILQEAQLQFIDVTAQEGITWSMVKTFIPSDVQNDKLLDSLYQYAKQLSADSSQAIIEATAAYLFETFYKEKMLLQKHVHALKELYGPVSSGVANKICETVRTLSSLNEDAIASIGKKLAKKKTIYGCEIKMSKIKKREPELEKENILKLANINLKGKFCDNFSIRYKGESLKDRKKKEDVPSRKFDRSWLIKELKNQSAIQNHMNTDVENLAASILERLKSERSNDELQNELFDLLGFDYFELIKKLLQNRDELTQIVPASKTVPEPKRPTIATQVVVQLEHEKIFQKLARKEEKRNHRMASSMHEEEEEEIVFDTNRENRVPPLPKLETSKPSLSKRKEPERYPHVYDSQSQAKSTAGFISGVKMTLPDNIKKSDKKLYEEVLIPVSEPPPVNVGNKLIRIPSLNKIGQIAFEGVEKLNRIQSVVFDTAYHTNENLLICAPTGAGKTNVALLTIAHQIEQHVENDVIKKDSFKIVYVAPMKALAAEMTRSFSNRLNPLGITVQELTGDMQLTKTEILKTQMIITTPEKWDVVTRKGSGDLALTKLVKLLIIDEVHLLHGNRGPVVEALVARTLRQVETSQSMIRIVGLSATLPNYLDVARFLRVNPYIGLFFFDSRFRPVPLSQSFVGIKAMKPLQQMNDMDLVCYEKVAEQVQRGHQVMVFVHARNATVRTATVLKELALKANQSNIFEPNESPQFSLAKKSIGRMKNKRVADLFQYGFSCHHAGMLRADRSIVEKYFADGLVNVLVCTATLAWGVNLPAHAVIIRGTEIYDPKHGSFVDLGILDVLQIFGRAGRPQFDTSGHGVIITSYNKLSHYLSLMTDQFPIESNFINFLADNLNAEIALGTISNVDEAVEWLSYTYLFVRMRVNPLVYGITYKDVQEDPHLNEKRRELIHAVSKALDKARMIRYNERTGDLNITDLGRTASHFYIKYDTVEVINEMFKPIMTDCDVFSMVAHSQEFQQLKVRDDELVELDTMSKYFCELEVTGGSENLHGKVNILLQTFLSRGDVESFSLISDQSYIIQNAVRIVRALFDIALKKNNALMSGRFLLVSKMFELQMWDHESPLKQFGILGSDILSKLEDKRLSVEKLREMDPKEIGNFLRNPKMGNVVQRCALEIPLLEVSAALQPITRTVLRIRLTIRADFKWNDRVHGKTSEAFWIWIEDPNTNFIYHSEYFLITKRQVMKREEQEIVMTIPVTEPLPSQYFVRVISDKWIGSDMTEPLSFQNVTLPESHPPFTDLLPLQPLPVTALENPKLESLYKFSHFNPIQTQIFHCLYHTDNNVLLGAPTGSGKTIAAEIAIFRVFREYPRCKVVYIAPLKALVRERIADWKIRLEKNLNYRVVELTGDVCPDIRAISSADVIVTTPEKWDGISRSWQTRNYVRDVALIVIDEIHLLGEDRGPVLEVLVSRTNYISSHTSRKLRIIGLSTALANAKDLADWLGIGQMGLYNFRSSVRPVPLEVHISGFPGKHYCPRMATMNRPTFQAIRQYSPTQPALIFVSSRRQTRLTALDLIAFLAAEDDPKQWMHTNEREMDQIISSMKDSNLRLTLAFGIGMHHAGLTDRDRKTVEELFVNQKIQVLIATATLAWGVNFPAHLVVIKGTEYYDGKLKRYVDMPITDVMQMMGRAGRPQFDEQGVAVVLVHDVKKNFYKKFLHEPFPVESSLLEVLPDHLNAEIVAGTVQSKQDALDYLTWTYFFRRLIKNPTYYQLDQIEPENINRFLSELIERCCATLQDADCVVIQEDNRSIGPTTMGRISSFYYLSHLTMRHFAETLRSDLNLEELLQVLADAQEYDQLPVRHNEEILNEELSKKCPLAVNQYTFDSPHTKAQLLFQAHFSRIQLPCVDYVTDLKSVLDQAIRILQAMIDVCGEQGWLATTIQIQELMQMVVQGMWVTDSSLMVLPNIEAHHCNLFKMKGPRLTTLPGLQYACADNYALLASIIRSVLQENEIEEIHDVLVHLPSLSVDVALQGPGYDKDQPIKQPLTTNDWVFVEPQKEYTLVVKLRRLNKNKNGSMAYSPRFPRGTDEGWFLTLGCVENKELVALKRVPNVRGNVSVQSLTFTTPEKLGRFILTIYVMSNCYVGFDQQLNVNLEVVKKIAVTEINGCETEIRTKPENGSDSEDDQAIGRAFIRRR